MPAPYSQKVSNYLKVSAISEEHGHKDMNPRVFANHINEQHGEEIRQLSDGKLTKVSTAAVYRLHPTYRTKGIPRTRLTAEYYALWGEAGKNYDSLMSETKQTPSGMPQPPADTGDVNAVQRFIKELEDYKERLKRGKTAEKEAELKAKKKALFGEDFKKRVMQQASIYYDALGNRAKTSEQVEQFAYASLDILGQLKPVGTPKHKGRSPRVITKEIVREIRTPAEIPQPEAGLSREEREGKFLEANGALVSRIIVNLRRHDRIGHAHSSEDDIITGGLAKDKRGEGQAVLNYMMGKGWLNKTGKKGGENQYSLTPEQYLQAEMDAFVAKYPPINGGKESPSA